MASKQIYECYVCKRNGFPDTKVFLDGKTEDGKTIYKNPDMSPHLHKQQGKQQPQQQVQEKDNPIAPVSDESVDRGISAFTMMTDLIRLVEQTQKLLVTMDAKLDRLLNLSERKQ